MVRIKERVFDRLFVIYQRGYLNRKIILLMDIIIAIFSAIVSELLTNYFLNLSGAINYPMSVGMIILIVLSTLLYSALFNTHKQIFRFSSMYISRAIVFFVLANTATIILAVIILTNVLGVPLDYKALLLFGVLFLTIFFFLFVLARAFLIVVARWIKNGREPIEKQKKRVLIFDVRDSSVAAAKLLEDSNEYIVLGYCTKEEGRTDYQIDGKPIYHVRTLSDLVHVARLRALQGIIFPAKQDFLRERESFIFDCESIGLSTYLMPGVSESNATKIASESVQKVQIEDLLMRDEIEHSKEDVIKMYKDKVVLVTGAAGSIGSELVKQVATLGVKKLILYDNAETPLHNIRLYLEKNYPDLDLVPIIGDVRIRSRLRFLFEKHRPNIVLHAAAYKHVPLMEENPCESILVNIIGTKNIADYCLEYGVERMVMVSTDKAVNPTNVMGACKRAAEMYVQSLGKAIETGQREGKTIFITTRFGNVLGSQGSVIHLFRSQIAEGGPVTVTHPDIVRFFMSIPEACSLILEASSLAKEAQIYVFDMGEEHKIVDLARNMIRLSGLEPDKDIQIKFTGLRPGEKLYEEVLANGENTYKTEIDKVMIAHVRPVDYAEVAPIYNDLENLARQIKLRESVQLLKVLVPEYKSANSMYSELDK